MKNKWPLNTLIPLMVLTMGFILLAVYLTINYGYQKSQFQQLTTQRLTNMGPRLTDITQRMLALGDEGLLGAEMESMRHMTDVGVVVITDEFNTILYASDVSLRGTNLEATELGVAAELINSSDGAVNQVVRESTERQQLVGVFSYSVPRRVSSNDAQASGHIAISIDLEDSNEALQAALWSQALVLSLLLTVVAGALWYTLHRVVIRPLRKIVTSARAIAAGDYTVRTGLASKNELGEISATLDALALSCLQQTETQNMHRRLSQLVDEMVDEVYVCDVETLTVLNTNKAARANLGYRADELHEMEASKFVTGRSWQDMKEFLRPLLDGSVSHLDCMCSHTCKDGSTYPVKARMQYMAHLSPPVLVTMAQDLSELESQRENTELRERALGAVSEGIIIARAPEAGEEDRIIVYVNQAVCDMSGFASSELLGKSTDFLRKKAMNQPCLKQVKKAIGKSEPVSARLLATRKDGSNYNTEVSISPVLNDFGEVTHYIGVQRDITQRLLDEEKLHQSDKIKAIGHLSGGLAHDFNNLLSVIVGNLEFLRTSVVDKDQKARIEGAENAAHMGSHLTRRLLSFASQQRLVPVVTNVNDHIHRAVALLAPTIGETISLKIDLEAVLWNTLSDPGEVETAIINLTINARDAMPQGGSINITTDNVAIDEETVEREMLDLEPGEYVRICVIDNGPGISKDVRGRIFEPFVTTKPESEGSGLGLASVFGFARQSGGDISVESTENEGTRFCVYLPKFLPEPDSSSALARTEVQSDLVSHDIRVLVVEDKDMVRDLTVQQLTSLGFRTMEVENGVKAIELLETSVEVDLVLSDVVMPGGVSGYDVARWIRHNRPECGVLMTSGFSGPADGEGDEDTAKLHVLQKPYRMNELRSALQEVMGGRQRQREVENHVES